MPTNVQSMNCTPKYQVLGCGLSISFPSSISILPYHESLPVPQDMLPFLFGLNCFRIFPHFDGLQQEVHSHKLAVRDFSGPLFNSITRGAVKYHQIYKKNLMGLSLQPPTGAVDNAFNQIFFYLENQHVKVRILPV